jgi:hypothetical protein
MLWKIGSLFPLLLENDKERNIDIESTLINDSPEKIGLTRGAKPLIIAIPKYRCLR